MARTITPAQHRATEALVEAMTGDGIDVDEARELIGDYWRANVFPEIPPPATPRVVTVTRHRDGTADTRAFDRVNLLADNQPITLLSGQQVDADLDQDPIIVALARELTEAPEPIRHAFGSDTPVGEGMRLSAQSEYRRRGGTGAPLIGQVAAAITRRLEKAEKEAPADAAERLATAAQLAAALGDALPGDNWHMADVIRRLCAGEITPAEALDETDDE
ncbi:hypothetical protein [Actinacidiphila sp. bgisy160]|uniref:hypothetical protein n=1 Tax=Actinacidiphila sp. bgisy160 TaxID=3413796 RepID=UPI003D709C59